MELRRLIASKPLRFVSVPIPNTIEVIQIPTLVIRLNIALNDVSFRPIAEISLCRRRLFSEMLEGGVGFLPTFLLVMSYGQVLYLKHPLTAPERAS